MTKKAAPAPVPFSRLPAVLVSRRWWWVTLLVILGMIVLARLGFWQLDRRAQRQARNAEFVAQLAQEMLVLSGEPLSLAPAELRDRQAQVSGRYDFERQILLTEQRFRDRPGAHLVTPLLIGESGRAILVDRGWIPAAEADLENLVTFDEPAEQTVVGYLQLSQTLPGGRQVIPEEAQQIWFRLDIEAIQAQLPYELLPVYLLAAPEGELESLPYRIEPEVDLSEGPHLSYAIQWFIFTTILGVGYVRFVQLQGDTKN